MPSSAMAVEIRRRHAATFAAAIGADVAIAVIVGDDQDDVGLLILGGGRPPTHQRHR